MKNVLTAAVLAVACGLQAEPVALFDGKTFANWEGNIGSVWRIESGEIVAGTLNQKQGKNDFLCSTKDYGDFELRLKYRRLDNRGCSVPRRTHSQPP